MREQISTNDLRPVSPASAAAYRDARFLMTSVVDRELADRGDIADLVGDNPLRMMFSNHRNHAEFMTTVLDLGLFELLARVIPWAYRAYTSQGFSPDYFTVELAAWRRAVEQHLTSEAAAEILPLYHWMSDHHDQWLEDAREVPPSLLSGEGPWQGRRREFFDALSEGSVRDAQRCAQDVITASDDLFDFLEQVVAPAMAEIGLRWEIGEISPAQEHRAASIAMRVLAGVQTIAPPSMPTRGRALVAAAANEYHELGAQMVAMVLEGDGWDVSYLGGATPSEDLLGLACDEKPSIVAISVAMPYNVEHAAELIGLLRDTPETSEVAVLLGGQAFADIPEMGLTLNPDAMPAGLRELQTIARRWSTA